VPLIRAARQVNDGKPRHVVQEVVARGERFRDPVIAVLGLAFKANVDDLRESPALEIAEELGRRGVGRLLVVEPHVDSIESAALQAADAKLVDITTAIAEADIVVLLVDHDAFRRVRRNSLRVRNMDRSADRASRAIVRKLHIAPARPVRDRGRHVRATTSTRCSRRATRMRHRSDARRSPCRAEVRAAMGTTPDRGIGAVRAPMRSMAPGMAPSRGTPTGRTGVAAQWTGSRVRHAASGRTSDRVAK